MTIDELTEIADREYMAIQEMIEREGVSHVDEDVFYGFAETAHRILGNANKEYQFKILLIHMYKHFLALTNYGIENSEAEKHLRNIIVYCFTALAMAKDIGAGENK